MNAVTGMRLEAREVTREFSGAGAGRVTAVDRVSLVLEPGRFGALSGRSGAGKTVLLSLLGGLDRPSAGSVLSDGADLEAMTRSERTKLARTVGIVFQNAAVIRRMPVWENVACGLIPLGVPSAERLERALEALRTVELEPFAWRRPEHLSAGERQRVALARATTMEPRLLLADEPTSNLDEESAAIVCDVLTRLSEAGCTVLAASHDRDVLSRARVRFRLESGRLRGEA
jgi:putative ABC transport system ATP-binding protein